MCTCRQDVSGHRTEGFSSSISRVTCLLWKPGLGCDRMFGSCTSSSSSCPQQCRMWVGQISRAWRKIFAAVIFQNRPIQEISGMFGRCILSLPRRSAQARCASNDDTLHTGWLVRGRQHRNVCCSVATWQLVQVYTCSGGNCI